MRKLLALLVVLCFTSALSADTIYLTNGRVFHGTVTEHAEVVKVNGDERLYRVYFGSTDRYDEDYKGYLDVEKKNVGSVVKNDKDSFEKKED